MTPERWRAIGQVYLDACDRKPEERAAFLDDACGEDAGMRREVDLLLERDDVASFLEQPAYDAPVDESQTAITAGRQLGQYVIAAPIGAGAMGEVFRATDTKLRRDVAIKVLPALHARSPEQLARFQREARMLAALNHPNVATLHGIEQSGDVHYLVMELVPGDTVARRISNGPVSLELALSICAQLADGLAAAHEKGITHRDIKPANIKITPEGRVKVLDFGIAKPTAVELAGGAAQDGTAENPTREGQIIGTPAYMSPEQIRGQPVDQRSDVWAFGCVLYELLSGKRAFAGGTLSDTMAKVLEREPDWSALPASTPPRVIECVKRCLTKDLDRRMPRIADARELLAASASGAGWFTRRRLAAAIALAAILPALYWFAGRRGDRLSPGIAVRRSVAVLGFKNLSGRPDNAWLSTALSEMFTSELAAGEKLRTIPGETVGRMKLELALTEIDSFAPATLNKIRKNIAADFVVLGAYYLTATDNTNKIRLDLRLQDTASGEVLASAIETGSEGELLDLVSRGGVRLRDKLGAGPMTPQAATGVRAAAAATPDALRWYAEGLSKLRVFDALAARDLLEKAVAADPGYPLAHSALAAAWSALGYDAKARGVAQKAFELSAKLPREDRLWVEGRYRETAREWTKAVEIYRTLFGFFPDNVEYGLRLAAAQTSAGKGKEAMLSLESLRKLPAAASDARVDMAEGMAAGSLSDFKRQQSAASKAAGTGRQQGASLLVAEARLEEGVALNRLGRLPDALTALEEANRLYVAAGHNLGQGRVNYISADLLSGQGRLAEARKRNDEALAVFRRTGFKRGEASALNLSANVAGDFAERLRIYEEARAAFREVGDKPGEAGAYNNTAAVLQSLGNMEAANKAYEQSLAIYREAGNRRGEAMALNNLGLVLLDRGDARGSKNHLQQALALYREVGNKAMAASTTYALGRVTEAQGDLTGARKAYEEAWATDQELGNQLSLSRLALAALSIEEGRAVEAESPAREVAEKFRGQKASNGEARALTVVARSLLAQGKVEDALATIDRVMLLPSKSKLVGLQAAITEARIRAATGRRAEAARSLATLRGETNKSGLVSYQLEIRLALGELEGKTAAGRERLLTLEKDAATRGFGLIARKAAALRRTPGA